jgi:hypothetical protein
VTVESARKIRRIDEPEIVADLGARSVRVQQRSLIQHRRRWHARPPRACDAQRGGAYSQRLCIGRHTFPQAHKAIGEIKNIEGMAWITALKSTQIRGLVEAGALQLGLFDERNLCEFSDLAYPEERLIACRNPELAKLRGHKRQALLEATTLELDKIRDRVARGALEGAAAIGVKLGRVLDKYKVGKHLELTITDSAVKFQILETQVAAEPALDGIYVIRTGLPKTQMSAPEAVRSYKALAQVERAFRSLKTVDLKIRPIHHRLESRVRAHLPVHARLLRRVASDRSVAAVAVRR